MPPSIATGPRARVLYVDDHRDLADSAVLLLELYGFEARAAYDGPSALAAAARFEPEVCVLDLNMPGMNGDELAGKLAALVGEKPLLLVAATAKSDEDSQRRIAAAGFARHLVKPVPPDELITAIDTHRPDPNVRRNTPSIN